ncbi:GNAT family N-acetyltransferase [Chitinophaga horti]|uniref:GNAT family N-acetyltransferase n=1 Tax=Chitinophaga horti TaxID=2920382 RepID=A0ABY6J150_9BACT|nr:GNAT family N-acetyltransferase [Chitinophaga horti]UYQ93381.1 GNAT family N-acetyltransferase [Chitinophaga horti]
MADNQYYVSTEKERLDVEVITEFLSRRSYWARGRSREEVERSIKHSLCFGVYTEAGTQVAFGRVVTDYTVFAWVMDVFVLEPYRGQGISKLLMENMLAHPELQTLKRWGLGTSDAHRLYEQFGFRGLSHPEKMMERL